MLNTVTLVPCAHATDEARAARSESRHAINTATRCAAYRIPTAGATDTMMPSAPYVPLSDAQHAQQLTRALLTASLRVTRPFAPMLPVPCVCATPAPSRARGMGCPLRALGCVAPVVWASSFVRINRNTTIAPCAAYTPARHSAPLATSPCSLPRPAPPARGHARTRREAHDTSSRPQASFAPRVSERHSRIGVESPQRSRARIRVHPPRVVGISSFTAAIASASSTRGVARARLQRSTSTPASRAARVQSFSSCVPSTRTGW